MSVTGLLRPATRHLLERIGSSEDSGWRRERESNPVTVHGVAPYGRPWWFIYENDPGVKAPTIPSQTSPVTLGPRTIEQRRVHYSSIRAFGAPDVWSNRRRRAAARVGVPINMSVLETRATTTSAILRSRTAIRPSSQARSSRLSSRRCAVWIGQRLRMRDGKQEERRGEDSHLAPDIT
jgi:hypothetical protein